MFAIGSDICVAISCLSSAPATQTAGLLFGVRQILERGRDGFLKARAIPAAVAAVFYDRGENLHQPSVAGSQYRAQELRASGTNIELGVSEARNKFGEFLA
jgi:hypothetical protein